jgi:hypothetical protein
MASKFKCGCGNEVYTNVFEGHGVCSLVADNDIDKLNDSISAKEVGEIWLNSQRAIKCKNCGRLYLAQPGSGEYEVYEKIDG